MTGLIDTHCHLTAPTLRMDLDAVLGRARIVGITAFVTTATDLDDAVEVVALTLEHRDVFAAIGTHPLWASSGTHDIERLAFMISRNPAKIVAIGEIGLDKTTNARDLATQERVFSDQVALARDLGLPVMVHCRKAFDRVADILESFGPGGPGGVIHAYGGSAESMTRLHRLGFKRGVGGGATREGARRTREAVALTPIEQLVLETDAPWIATANKGKGSVEPADIVEVLHAVAMLHDTSDDEVAEIIGVTTRSLLNL